MYLNGRWVPEHVVSTMFVAWLIGVGVFLAILFWQLHKHRHKRGGAPRTPPRRRKSRSTRHRSRNGR